MKRRSTVCIGALALVATITGVQTRAEASRSPSVATVVPPAGHGHAGKTHAQGCGSSVVPLPPGTAVPSLTVTVPSNTRAARKSSPGCGPAARHETGPCSAAAAAKHGPRSGPRHGGTPVPMPTGTVTSGSSVSVIPAATPVPHGHGAGTKGTRPAPAAGSVTSAKGNGHLTAPGICRGHHGKHHR